MALFKRKKKDSVLPEIDKYYEGERRDRTGVAWLLAIVSVLVVALFLVGIFLAGRWAYRTIKGNDTDVAITTTDGEDALNLPSFDGKPSESTENKPDSNEKQEDSPNSDQSPSQDESEGTVEAPATPGQTNPDSAAPTTPPTTTVPSTGDSPLPNTGPTENLLAIFLVVSIATGSLHFAVNNRKD